MKRTASTLLLLLAFFAVGACRHTKPAPTTSAPAETTTSAAPSTTTTAPPTTTTQPVPELSDVALGFNNAEQGVIAPDGTQLVVFMRLDSVEVVRRTDGTTVRAGGAGRVATPAITVGGSRVVVAWAEGSGGGETVIKAAVSDTSGASFGQEQVLGEGGGPSLAASGDEIFAVWHTGKEGESNGDIMLARLSAGSESWETEDAIDESAAAPLWASVDARDSTLAVTWRDNRTGEYSVWTRTSDDLGRTWNSEVQVLTTNSGDPDVCIDPAGTIWLGYHGRGDISLTKSTDGGSSFDPAERVGDGWFAHLSCDSNVIGVAWEETTSPPKAPEAEKAAGWATYDTSLERLSGGSEGAPDAVAATVVPAAGGGLELLWVDPAGEGALSGTLRRSPIPT